jgi:hypothetical protein
MLSVVKLYGTNWMDDDLERIYREAVMALLRYYLRIYMMIKKK